MRFRNWLYVLGAVILLAANWVAFAADDRGTPEQAKVLVERAAVHVKEVGADKAFADFNDKQGGYQERDLFVFAYAKDGKIVCVPGIPALVGQDANALKDVDGKEFGKLIIAAAKAGGGWAEYRMTNPATKKIERKKTYAVQAGDFVLGVGAYNP